MKKAVFFDIDGTLWDFKMNIPESTKKALKELRKNGYYAFLCSGRSRSNIKSPKLLALGFDGIVAACGTHIEFEGEKLFELLLTKAQIEHILTVLRKHQIPMVLEGPNYIYVDEKDFKDDPYVIYLRNELGENLKSIIGTAQYEVNKLSAELGNADVELVRKELGTEFDMIVHEPDGILEIGQAGHSKASGIERLCASLGIAKEDTYAFGDSANDVEMLEFVAHGIAMGNGTDVAKNAAEFVTTDIHKDGIWNGLKHYGLI